MGHGGAENVFRWLAQGLQKAGVDVVAGICMDNNPEGRENWIDPALDELEIPKTYFDKRGSAVAMLKSMKKMIARTGPDIVHSHLLDANFYSALACRRLSIPHVCTEHGDIRFNKRTAARIKFGLLSALSTSVVCVSQSLRGTAATLCLNRKKLITIYNGISFPEQKRSAFRKEQDIPETAMVVGNVGNLYPVKGQRYLIEAFARFLSHAPSAYLILVGRGSEESRLRQHAHKLAIPADRIIFTGFRKDVDNILNALDIYVQPSLSEGFPVAVLEALSLDLPVIATSVGGVPEVITDDKIGILVPPGSSGDICEALKTISRNFGAYTQCAKKAGAYVREKFSVSQMTNEYLALYRKLLRFDKPHMADHPSITGRLQL